MNISVQILKIDLEISKQNIDENTTNYHIHVVLDTYYI
jgi:hypothetical protein